MRQSLFASWLAYFGWLSIAAGCSSAHDEKTAITTTPTDYCQRRCDKAHGCNDAINPAECRSSCQSALATQPQLRADFLGYVAGCIDTSGCDSTTTSKCKSEAQAQLAVSKYGESFCSAYVAAGNQCDDTGAAYPASACLEAAKTYDDGALKAANDCLAEPCSGLHACLARTIPQATLTP